MAVEKTPTKWIELTPSGVYKFYKRFEKDFLGYYFKDGELNELIKSVNGFRPSDYDIPCARMDGNNSSFLLTPYGYAINVTIFKRNRKLGILPELGKDGVIYTPNKKSGLISIDDMTKHKDKRTAQSYKDLCNRFLKSSRNQLQEVTPKNFVNPWF
jgi:hypothetical protein